MQNRLLKAQSLDNGLKKKNLNLKTINDVFQLDNMIIKRRRNMRCLYFLFNNNELQYIGITRQLKLRLKQHKKKSIITFDAFRCIYGNFGTRDEIELIKLFKPPFNKAMNPDYHVLRPLFNGKNLIGRNNWE